MLIMCLFLLSAVLAPVLIAIYILHHFLLGKEPTLKVPNWQNWAFKQRTICCCREGPGQHWGLRVCVHGAWCVSGCVHTNVCCVHVHNWCDCLMYVYACVCMCTCKRHTTTRVRGDGKEEGGIRAFIPV